MRFGSSGRKWKRTLKPVLQTRSLRVPSQYVIASYELRATIMTKSIVSGGGSIPGVPVGSTHCSGYAERWMPAQDSILHTESFTWVCKESEGCISLIWHFGIMASSHCDVLAGSCLQITRDHNVAEEHKSECGQNREHRGHGLPQSNGPRYGGASQDQGGQEAQLGAVRLAILLSVPAEDV